jgi:hypothetical protein
LGIKKRIWSWIGFVERRLELELELDWLFENGNGVGMELDWLFENSVGVAVELELSFFSGVGVGVELEWHIAGVAHLCSLCIALLCISHSL